jgi:hypothetical protein
MCFASRNRQGLRNAANALVQLFYYFHARTQMEATGVLSFFAVILLGLLLHVFVVSPELHKWALSASAHE